MAHPEGYFSTTPPDFGSMTAAEKHAHCRACLTHFIKPGEDFFARPDRDQVLAILKANTPPPAGA